MSLIIKNSARLRDQERARLIWLLTIDKTITSTLLSKLAFSEKYDAYTLSDNISEIRILVTRLPPPDLADTLEALPSEERHALWRLVQNHERGQVLLEASENVLADLIDKMSNQDILEVLKTLDIDEQIYLVQHLPRNLTSHLLETLSTDAQARVRQIMYFDKDSVGAIMKFEVIIVRQDVTLGVVQRYLRRLGKIPENTDKLFVTSRDKTLLGELELQTILLNGAKCKVGEVMNTEPMIFSPKDDAEKAARTFERNNLISAAVVDSVGRLMGRITIDEIVDVVYEETDNDLRALGGLSAEDDVYASVGKAVKTRWTWLAINLCTAFVASRVIHSFEHTISQLVALASLMPIVAGIGGNTGNQTITMIVRALALENIQTRNFSFLIFREVGVALINGLVLGGIMGGIAWWLYDDIMLGGVMMLSMIFNLIIAAVMGVVIPLILTRLEYDPAIGSSVMITAITDTGGFFIFLGLATIFLL